MKKTSLIILLALLTYCISSCEQEIIEPADITLDEVSGDGGYPKCGDAGAGGSGGCE